MSAGSWPVSLPQLPDIGVSAELLPNYIESEVDAGSPKRRRATTKDREIQNVPLTITGAQKAILWTFYKTTLKSGSLTFDWTDAIDDTSRELKFVNPPKVNQWTAASDPDDRIYQMSLELEVV